MSNDTRATREVVYRAILAPNKLYAEWTVDDFRRFVSDCDAQGITGDTRVTREVRELEVRAGACLIAERLVSLGTEPRTEKRD